MLIDMDEFGSEPFRQVDGDKHHNQCEYIHLIIN